MSSEEEILDRLLPEFQEALNVQQIKPYLKATHLLTDDEYEQLCIGPNNPTGEVCGRLITLLKRKGPHCANMLLAAMQHSVSGPNVHVGHFQIISSLERELKSARMRPYDSNGPRHANSGRTKEPGVTDNGVIPDHGSKENDWDQPNGSSHQQPHPAASNTTPLHLRLKAETTEDSPWHSNEPVQLMKYEYLEPSQQNAKQMENLRHILVRESKMIRKEYTDFVVNVCELLESSPSATIEKVRLSLQCLGCYRTNSGPQVFDSTSPIMQASSVASLLGVLQGYTSWFNYDLISYVAQRFGGEEGRRLVQAYKAKLKSYFQRLVFQCPPFSSKEQHPLQGFKELEVKLDWDFRTCSVQDVAIFKSTLSSLLELEPCMFVLKSVMDPEACVQLTWAIPACAVPHTIACATSKMGAFTKNSVLSLRIGTKVISYSSKAKRSTGIPSTKSSNPHVHQRSLVSLHSTESTLTTGGGHSSSHHSPNSSSVVSLIPQKSYPTISLSSLQAYGISMDEASGAKTVATLEPQGLVDAEPIWTERYRSQTDTSVRDYAVPFTQVTTADSANQILPLAHSPILVHGSYFQFYYKQDQVCLPSALAMATKSETPGQKSVKQGHVLFSAPPKSQIKPATDAQINASAIQDPYLEGGRSRMHFQTDREQELASVSADQQAESVNSSTPIAIRRFESESSELGGPKSPDVVNILHDLHTASTPDPPVTEATEECTTMDVMLSAANEVRRRRARRKGLRSSASSQENGTDRNDKPLIQSEYKTEALPLLEKEANISTRITGNSSLSNCQLIQASAVVSEPQKTSRNITSFPSHDHYDLSNSRKWTNASSALAERQNTQNLESTLESTSPEPLESPTLTEQEDLCPVFSPPFTIPQSQLPTPSSKPHKSVAFLWRLLGRASFRWPANLQVAAIQSTDASSQDDLAVRKGQQLKALYRISNRVFVQTLQNQRGFIPYSSCRISRRHYGSASKIMRMSYSQLYIQSPDGIDSENKQFPSDPSTIEVVTIQGCNAAAKEDLAVRVGEKLQVLYCDDSWVYAVSEQHNAGFLPRVSCRLTRKCQKLYKNWIGSHSHFQADFAIKFSEPPPLAVKRNIQKPLSLTSLPSQATTATAPKPLSLGNLPSQCTAGTSTQKPSSLSNLPSHAITVGQKPLSVTLSLPSQALKAKRNIPKPLSLSNLPRQTHASKIGKIMAVTRNYVPSFGDPSLTICKGLRVRVMSSDGDLLHVVTKSGIPFWIPSNYLRPVIKTSNRSNFFNLPVLDAPLIDEDIDAPIPEMASPQYQFEHDEHVYESISSSHAGKVISGGELPFNNNLSTKAAVLARSSDHVSHNITATRVKAQNSPPKLTSQLQDSVESLEFV